MLQSDHQAPNHPTQSCLLVLLGLARCKPDHIQVQAAHIQVQA